MATFTLPDIHFDPEGLAKIEELVTRMEKVACMYSVRDAEVEHLRAALRDIAHGVIGNLSATEQVKILMFIADKALREMDGK